MKKNIYCGRGSEVAYADFMDLINLSFGRTSPDAGFVNLLPKLYREEDRPQGQNYVVTEDGYPVAAVGAYGHELRVCGRTLTCRGIGNVAVHPEHRSKGYMNLAMDAAMRDMISDGVALSALGGQRQRYLYFGYDKTGSRHTYSISGANIRHAFGDLTSPYTVREVTDPADEVVDSIVDLNCKREYIPVRSRERYLDIAGSWGAKLLVALDGDRFVGYCILGKGNSVSEIDAADGRELVGFVRSLFAYIGDGFDVCLMPHQIDYRKALEAFAEGVRLGCAGNFNVLDYRAVIEAFIALKLSFVPLPDGSLTMLIHGYAGDELIRVTVRNGCGSVERVDGSVTPDIELGHAEALSVLFAPASAIREQLSIPLARLWFPLPLCMLRADGV